MRRVITSLVVIAGCSGEPEPSPMMEVSCFDNSDCDSTQLCDHPETTCGAEGVCRTRPDAETCEEECAVLGCDGVEYASACAAANAGVDFAFICARGTVAHTLVIDSLRIAEPDPTGDPSIIAGFDLDDRVSDDYDESSCLHADRTSPPPESEPGVDNQLGPLLGSLMGFFGDDMDFTPLITRGALLIVIEARRDEDVVQLDLYAAVTPGRRAPELDAAGRLAPDQELELVRQLARLEGAVDDTFDVGPGTADLPVLASIPATVRMRPARARLRALDDGTAEGVIGGGVFVEDATALAVTKDPESIPGALARSVSRAQADLERDGSGNCTHISGAWAFTAVPARIVR
jgi:hypothetical protein